MKSSAIRQQFLDFFESKQHKIVPSAPMVVKNDPTLMFTNAGMNQFKDIFLGNSPVKYPRIADTQKCLRVSGKHNDLEEVGHDTYHHTMFEMLGNWSFGDYFKKDAIDWAWELLVDVYKIDKNRLYATYFGGDPAENLEPDTEALNLWKQYLPEERILPGSKKDNFWEMGDSGPCGPCSEIHVDLRDDAEIAKLSGRELVNQSHHLVIEIWNLVFIQFNRKADSSLEQLPNKHVDTGMGFERLCMVLQHQKSNYDTDVFQPLIQKISEISGVKYGISDKSDIAMRVIADHLRTIAFAIADGQLPSNNKAGYVIRRILRRAVRYAYTFLNTREPFLNLFIPTLVGQMGAFFPELSQQQELIKRVIIEEEVSFLKTLSVGIGKFETYIANNTNKKVIDGNFAFELFDTYGFPIDLTQLMAREKDWEVDMDGFNIGMQAQKERSRQAAAVDTDDWVVLKPTIEESQFVGYDALSLESEIVKYRKVSTKDKTYFQIVLDRTPFYGESGGQAGDKGFLVNDNEQIEILDTQKENNLTIHIVASMPKDPTVVFNANVDLSKRMATANNHSATHLLHSALREVLGTHVEQKGSLVNDERLRFDFSHFSKLTDEEIAKVEAIVNAKIRENIKLEELRSIPIAKAQELGATALFGEKYGENVRVIMFDTNYSIELCGGTHTSATGNIGSFKIVSESAIAAGVRRIEAITSAKAESFINEQLGLLEQIKTALKNPKDLVKGVQSLQEENAQLQKQIAELMKEKAMLLKDELKTKFIEKNGIKVLVEKINIDPAVIKDLMFALKTEIPSLLAVIGSINDGKPSISVALSDNLVNEKGMNASNIVKDLAKEIQGGGGGQAAYATAGGKNPDGMDKALSKAKELI